MRSAVLAVTPTLIEQPGKLDPLCRQMRELQNRGLLRSVSVASVMHPDLYAYPASYYQLVQSGLTHRNRNRLDSYLRSRFELNGIHMLSSPSSENLTLAEKLSDFAERRRAEVLVVNQSEGPGWIRKIFHRVAETTAFSATLPVLVLNSGHEDELAKSGDGILFAVDPGSAPSDAELEYVAQTARLMSAEVHLLHVRPKRGPLAKVLGGRPPVGGGTAAVELWRIEACLRTRGVRVRSAMVVQGESIAASIERHAEAHRACITVVTSPERPPLRRFFLGSVARQLLRVSKRPVFVLRAEGRWPEKNSARPHATPAPPQESSRESAAEDSGIRRDPAPRGKIA